MTTRLPATSTTAMRLLSLPAGTALALAAVAVLGVSPAVAATGHAVTIQNFAFTPGSLTISVGDSVTWTNKDSTAHTATSTSGPASFNSGTLNPGAQFTFTFTTAGTYSYHCSFHPSMTATITVQQASSSAPASSAPASSTPASSAPASTSGASNTVAASSSSPAPPTSDSMGPMPGMGSAPPQTFPAQSQTGLAAPHRGLTLRIALLIVSGVLAVLTAVAYPYARRRRS